MNKPMCVIIGRKKETAELKRYLNSGRAELIAVYGRRRVGKTFLINEVFRDHMVFHHTGLSPYNKKRKVTLKDQLQNFYFSLLRHGAEGIAIPKSWMEAFFMLEQLLTTEDNGNCPYGEKSVEFIQDRARKITDLLLSKGARIIVIACNTATAAAIAMLREEYPVKFIGMEPAVKPAALSSRTGIIGVLATAGTLKASKYLNTRGMFEEGTKIAEHVGQGFVELVEAGELDGEHAESVVRQSVQPLVDAGADHIVLGCTHYPFLKETIEKVISELNPGRDIKVVDPAPAAARQLERVIREQGIPVHDTRSSTATPESPRPVNVTLFSSGSRDSLERIFKLI